MFEQLTDRARAVLQLARQEAVRLRHEYVGTEHLLLGLIAEGSGVAANVLKNMSVDLRAVRADVERIVHPGPDGDRLLSGRLPHTPRTQRALDLAAAEATELHFSYLGTEHLLLGLLREGEGVAAQVLRNVGLKLDDVRAEVLALLGHDPTPPSGGSASRPTEPPDTGADDPIVR